MLLLLAYAIFSSFRAAPPPTVTTSTSTTLPKPSLSVKSSDEVLSDIQKIQGIIDSGNSTACDGISDPGLSRSRELCYYNIAYRSRNETLCLSIVDGSLRERCVKRVRELMVTYGQVNANGV